jgi:hypothetical protein
MLFCSVIYAAGCGSAGKREPATSAAHRDSIRHIRDRCDAGGIVLDGVSGCN